MVIYIDSLRFTRIHGSADCYKEILPSGIAQQFLKFSGKPNFHLFTAIIV